MSVSFLIILMLGYYGLASVFLSSMSFLPYFRRLSDMSFNSHYVVFYVQSMSFDDKELLFAYYFDPSQPENTKIFKGWTPLKLNVSSNFSLDDFPAVPGLYKFSGRPVRKGKDMAFDLRSLDFYEDKPFTVEAIDAYLVLGAKKVDYTTPDGTQHKGIKIFCIDCMGAVDDTSLGYPLLEAFLDSSRVKNFLKECPGYYSLDFDMVRGKGGTSLLKVVSGSYIKSWVDGLKVA